MNDTKRYFIDITFTQKCNFKCVYCFEQDSHELFSLTDIDIDRYICYITYLLNSDFFKQCYNSLIIGCWGGEPLINVDMIYRLFSYFEHDERVGFWIFTNGSLIDDKFKEFILKNAKPTRYLREKVWVQVSYDFLPVHDINRRSKMNKPTSKTVFENLKWLAKQNINFGVKSTINPQTFKHLYDVYVDFYNFVTEYSLPFVYNPTIDRHNCDSNEQYLKVFEEQLVKIASFIVKTKENKFSLFQKNKALCSAGKDMVMFYKNIVYKCHGVPYLKNTANHPGHIVATLDKSYKDFVDGIIKSRRLHANIFSNQPEECLSCVALRCFRCPAESFDASDKKDYISRWKDYNNNKFLCSCYKLAGKIGLACSKLLHEAR